MRVCIIYDTKRRSTELFAKWIKEAFEENGEVVDIFKVNEFNGDFSYDLFVVSSPIYYEKPLKSITDFLQKYSDELSTKKLALFIVCMAKIFGKAGKAYIEKQYLKALESKVENLMFKSAVFKGWIKKVNLKEKKEVFKWVNSLIEKLEGEV